MELFFYSLQILKNIGMVEFEVIQYQGFGRVMEKLAGLRSKSAHVLRGGQEIEIPVEDVVIDDVVVLPWVPATAKTHFPGRT